MSIEEEIFIKRAEPDDLAFPAWALDAGKFFSLSIKSLKFTSLRRNMDKP
jgi:hypothetical protein